MNSTERKRTLTITAVQVTLMMLFLGGRATGYIALPPLAGGHAGNDTTPANQDAESRGESDGSTVVTMKSS